jgi:diphosphomevalonate decarboxylase
VWENESARQVFPPSYWDLRFCIAVCASGPKQVGSRDGMRTTRETSPYHPAWIEQCRRDLPAALHLLAARDLPGLGALAERNALRMHADALAADPPLLYWQPATVGCLQAMRELRASGVRAWATIDAGPHVVAICAAADANPVAALLRSIPGVAEVLLCAPAGGARLMP